MKPRKQNITVEEAKKQVDDVSGVVGFIDKEKPYLAVFTQPSSTTAYGSNTQVVSFETANIKKP